MRRSQPTTRSALPSPERKYAVEGGPTFKAGFDLLRRATAVPAVAVLTLLDAAIFNLIVGNADAHGKNFSLLYRAAGVTLAPFYDLLSTVIYPGLSPNLAMTIAQRATLQEIGPATWPAFADDIGFPASFVRRRVKELSDAWSPTCPLSGIAPHWLFWTPLPSRSTPYSSPQGPSA